MSLSRALVFALQGLGDSLEATPLLGALKAAGIADRIDVCTTRPESRDLFTQLDGVVDDVVYLPYWAEGIGPFLSRLASEAVRRRYDLSLMTYPAARREYHLMARMFRARRRVAHGYDRPSVANGLAFYTDIVPIRTLHNVERNLDLLRAIGYPDVRSGGRYIPPRSWVSESARAEKRVAIHVGSVRHDGLERRRWPSERFAEVGAQLADEGCQVVFIAGPAELELTTEIAARDERFELWRASLEETARMISTCALVIANDNGIAHLSAAVRTPVLALFGPTPVEHAPYGPTAVCYRPSACPSCFDPRLLNTNCALSIGYRCIREDITADAVLAQARRLLLSSQTSVMVGDS
jgi:ADP-heptose:LPS heptosyltransferase